jgi:ABC-2 type transport system permease protein
MRALTRETWFVLRSRTAVLALAALGLLASFAVALGLQETARQEAAIARMVELAAEDAAAVRRFASQEAGSAAYYRFHPTWDSPAPLAFAALGQRDVSPIMLRVRALALEGQIYENEALNPELALPGRFDFAFVLIYLAPLILIALLHDLWSGEREAGRWASLQAMPGARWQVWGARIAVRAGLATAVLLAPFLVGAALRGAAPGETAAIAGLVVLLVLFWTLAAGLIAWRGARSAANAAGLAAVWLVITLIAPTGAQLAIEAATPIPQGATLARENREAVHDAWDLDRNATLARFYQNHPEWAHSAPMTQPFHWKWYFAFQHLGDEHVAGLARAYREGVAERERRAGLVAFAAPPIAIMRAMHRIARTDLEAQLAYQDRIRAFHERLRRFYYPYLFDDLPFDAAAFDAAPSFR